MSTRERPRRNDFSALECPESASKAHKSTRKVCKVCKVSKVYKGALSRGQVRATRARGRWGPCVLLQAICAFLSASSKGPPSLSLAAWLCLSPVADLSEHS
eukprot:1774843-Rhodomonas_salina.1